MAEPLPRGFLGSATVCCIGRIQSRVCRFCGAGLASGKNLLLGRYCKRLAPWDASFSGKLLGLGLQSHLVRLKLLGFFFSFLLSSIEANIQLPHLGQ